MRGRDPTVEPRAFYVFYDPMEPMRMIDSDDMLMEQVEQALKMTPEERVWTGVELFESWVMLASSNVRQNFPDADEAMVIRKLEDRLEIARMLEGRGAA